MNELDEKIARGDAGLKIAEERAARRRQLAGLVAEEQRAADVEHQTDLIMTDLEKRTANVKENIAKNEADRAALSQAEADLLKTDHRIELAEGLSADCRQLLQNLADADKADEDAAARQAGVCGRTGCTGQRRGRIQHDAAPIKRQPRGPAGQGPAKGKALPGLRLHQAPEDRRAAQGPHHRKALRSGRRR